MKQILFGLLLIASTSCSNQPKVHKYFIIIYGEELSGVGDNYEPVIKRDSIETPYDSIAYKEGVFKYAGSLRAESLLQENNKIVGSRAKAFKVLDENGNDIKPRVSSTYIDYLETFVKQNKRQ